MRFFGVCESTAMARISTPDGVKLHVEEVGSGTPVIFVHEYAGDYRSWEPQLRHFSRQHRCVTYSQRGYPPSDVPSDPARYSQDLARDDVIGVMEGVMSAVFEATERAVAHARAGDGSAWYRQGARRRALDGRLHRVACRYPVPATLPVGDRRRLRLGFDPGRGVTRRHEGAGGGDRKDVRRRRQRFRP